jgi:hypothetical protein
METENKYGSHGMEYEDQSSRLGYSSTHHLIYHQIMMVFTQKIWWVKNGVSNYKSRLVIYRMN